MKGKEKKKITPTIPPIISGAEFRKLLKRKWMKKTKWKKRDYQIIERK